MFRIVVASSDGHQCGVPLQIDSHPDQARPYQPNSIADTLLIDRSEIRAVLERGTEAQLRKHLERYTKDQLKPLSFRRDDPERYPFFD